MKNLTPKVNLGRLGKPEPIGNLPHVVMVGDPTEGFTLYGPFPNYDAASHFAGTIDLDAPNWWVVPIQPPKKRTN